MKRRLFAPLSVAALVLALGTIAAACGGGDSGSALTLEEYFERISAAQTERDAQSRALDEEFNKEFESEEEQLKATQDFFDGGLTLLRGFVGALDDIDPPSEAKAAHEESVDAGNEAVEAIQQFVDRLKEAESASDLEEVFGDPGFTEAGDRFDQSCLALQGIADDNSIDVDLECADEG